MNRSHSTDWTGVSVVVPHYNALDDLDHCLAGLRAHGGTTLDIVVADDASTRGDPAAVCERHGARRVVLPRNAGPAVARNAGVAATDATVIVFIDADVVVHADTLQQALDALHAGPDIGACFGSYDERPADPAFLSQFRNLYHRWVHQSGDTEASTFWTGCGAVRREAFEAAGGFSAALSRMGMEDIDLGYRIRDAGYRIVLVKDMECTHLKAWTARLMVRTDVMGRGVPWMLLLLARQGGEADLNIDLRSRLATLAGGLLPVALLAALAWPPALWVAGLAGAVVVSTQWGFLRYVGRLRGAGFALRCVPALWLFFFCCAVSIPIAVALHLFGRGVRGKLAGEDPSGA